MAWSTPKVDWATDDAVGTTDLNRIEGNILDLRIKGAGLVSATSLDITGTLHVVSANNAIKYILKTGIVAGTMLVLKFSGTLVVHHMEGAPGAGYANINLGNSTADLNVAPDDVYSFIFDGTDWNLTPSI